MNNQLQNGLLNQHDDDDDDDDGDDDDDDDDVGGIGEYMILYIILPELL